MKIIYITVLIMWIIVGIANLKTNESVPKVVYLSTWAVVIAQWFLIASYRWNYL